MSHPSPEIRLSLRAAVLLFLVPQACMMAALSTLFLAGPDRAAPLRERRQAQAETIPPAPPAVASPDNPLPASLPGAPPAQPISMRRLLEHLLAPADIAAPPAGHPALPARPPESREALGTRLRAEIEDGFAAIEAAEPPDWLPTDSSSRLDEIRGLLGDLQALQTSFAALRGGGSGLGGAGDALAQVAPLLDALQTLRDGRLGQDPTLLDNLDRYLGRDEERPRRLGLLILLAWALDGQTAT